MEITFRNPSRDELKAFLDSIEIAFGDLAHESDPERYDGVLDLERCHWAFDGDLPVGGGAAYDFRLTIPGGEAPCAGVTMVGVVPSHRRRGILTQLMRRQLDEVHERGEPLALLWASEARIYGRFGYGVASRSAGIDIERDRAVFRDGAEPRGLARMVALADAKPLVAPVYDAVRAATPGMFVRTDAWWTNFRLADPEHWRRGAGPKFCAVVELDGKPEAYAIYRIKSDWEGGFPSSKLLVQEAIATSTEATREIWRFLFGVDLIERVNAHFVAEDHPLFLMVADPRRLRMTLGDGLWLRLVDVEAALATRGYADDASVAVELRDEFCPWNAGRWRLGPEGAERTDADAELALDVAELASAYLGGFSFAQLARAGRIEELRDGAIARADALFHTDFAPWCPEIF